MLNLVIGILTEPLTSPLTNLINATADHTINLITNFTTLSTLVMNSFTELQILIADFFNVETHLITKKSTAKEIPEWDSFSHMELMTSIESHFNQKLPFSEIMEFNNVGDIATFLDNSGS
jgi:acyl carrier protein